ncbi:peptidase inhibitor family I36 protein [Streptomyces sp. JNUCC 64]
MKHLIAKAGAAAVGTALLVGGLLATAAPANAAFTDCPSGALCAWLSPNAGGTPGTVYGDNANLLQYNKFNNAESVVNAGVTCNVRIYAGTGYTGASDLLERGYGYGDLRNTPWFRNIASNNWCV